MHTITVYSDFVCPYCLLAEKVLSESLAGNEFRIDWRAFELRPYPVPTLKPQDAYLPEVWRQSVYPLAERLGVPIRLPAISPQPRTRLASELLWLAQERGRGHSYTMQVLRAFFQDDQDIGNAEVLVRLAGQSGLDSEEARQALDSGRYSGAHRAAQHHARDVLGITSVPTIIVGNQTFRGIPAPAALASALVSI